MFGLSREWAASVAIWTISAICAAQAQPAPTPQIQPGEILIGYTSTQARNEAIKKLTPEAEALHINGEKPQAVRAQPMGEKGLKLTLDLLPQVAGGGADQAKTLEAIARQIKVGDTNVRYAHPNWTVLPKQPESAAPKRKKIAGQGIAAKRFKKHKVAGLRTRSYSRQAAAIGKPKTRRRASARSRFIYSDSEVLYWCTRGLHTKFKKRQRWTG